MNVKRNWNDENMIFKMLNENHLEIKENVYKQIKIKTFMVFDYFDCF